MLPLNPDMNLLDRIVLAVERVKDRLMRTSAALEAAGIPYAVAAWVATIDTAAVRNTQDVDILLRRVDLERAAKALESAGFIRRHVARIEMFLDGPDAKGRDAVHVVIAGEKVRPEYALAAPDVGESAIPGTARFVALVVPALVRMALSAFRLDDRVDLQDMLEVGLIDAAWVPRMGAELGPRLQQLIDTPGQ